MRRGSSSNAARPGEWVNDLARRARHLGLFLVAISQQLSDFAGEYGKALIRNSTMQLFLRQSPEELSYVQDALQALRPGDPRDRAAEDGQALVLAGLLDQRHPRPRHDRASGRPDASTGSRPPTPSATPRCAPRRCADAGGDAWAAPRARSASGAWGRAMRERARPPRASPIATGSLLARAALAALLALLCARAADRRAGRAGRSPARPGVDLTPAAARRGAAVPTDLRGRRARLRGQPVRADGDPRERDQLQPVDAPRCALRRQLRRLLRRADAVLDRLTAQRRRRRHLGRLPARLPQSAACRDPRPIRCGSSSRTRTSTTPTTRSTPPPPTSTRSAPARARPAHLPGAAVLHRRPARVDPVRPPRLRARPRTRALAAEPGRTGGPVPLVPGSRARGCCRTGSPPPRRQRRRR